MSLTQLSSSLLVCIKSRTTHCCSQLTLQSAILQAEQVTDCGITGDVRHPLAITTSESALEATPLVPCSTRSSSSQLRQMSPSAPHAVEAEAQAHAQAQAGAELGVELSANATAAAAAAAASQNQPAAEEQLPGMSMQAEMEPNGSMQGIAAPPAPHELAADPGCATAPVKHSPTGK